MKNEQERFFEQQTLILRKESQRMAENLNFYDTVFFQTAFSDDTAALQPILRIFLERPELEITGRQAYPAIEPSFQVSDEYPSPLVVTGKNGARKCYIGIYCGYVEPDHDWARIQLARLTVGVGYEEVVENHAEVIALLLSPRDVLGDGEPTSRIQNFVAGTDIRHEDGTEIVYVNGSYRGDDNIGQLIRDLGCTNYLDIHNEVLAEKMRFLKEDSAGIKQLLKNLMSFRKGLYLLYVQGVAQQMMRDEIPLEKISKYTSIVPNILSQLFESFEG